MSYILCSENISNSWNTEEQMQLLYVKVKNKY